MPKYKHSENVSQKFYLVRCNRSSATPKWNQKLKGPYLLLEILMSHTLTFSSKSNNNNKKKQSKPKAPISSNFWKCLSHKQPSRGVLRKMCSENMQQIYRRTPMSKCDFNKAIKAMQSSFIETSLRLGRSPVNLLQISRTSFPEKNSGGLLLLSLI